ncbi:uncharacterized protein LOC115444683 [Manduca sexta]|uniref:Uncharacterized protein n=1 Tax=Manduca sexta TaxID=7130 RepID=A0A922CN04_MANSE|nr:uncharacterized protein LOC115444683 [Manduca sexta]KAG6451879.1 hypothetical protein O3G_MSEX007337 [Manduca sexta]
MDCCNYGEYRAHGHGHGHGQYAGGASGAGAWEGYGYAPLPYTPYAAGYYAPLAPLAPLAHEPYARYYRYDYPGHHIHQAEHVVPPDYGAYACKEARVRRALARREQRALNTVHHLPLPPTPPLECGMNNRGPTYCDPQMWPHYQMGMAGGGSWNGANTANGSLWASRGSCSREHMRYPSDCRPAKAMLPQVQNQICHQDGRSTPYSVYEDSPFNGDSVSRHGSSSEFPAPLSQEEGPRAAREPYAREPRRPAPEEKRPPVVPLPAFQQAFGSTEIGKFAEAFSRAEVALGEGGGDTFLYESFAEWEPPTEFQWSSQTASREIKCEENY